jgi:hypothetical protein
MRTFLQMLVIGAALAVGAATAASAATATDPAIGTWKLNVAKSKFDSGPAFQSQTRTYASADDGLKLTFNGVAADGSSFSGESTYKYDGKDYPISGAPAFDTLAVTRVNSHTAKSKQKKAGKYVGSTLRTVSKDGTVMTLTSTGKNADGIAFKSTLVYDKQ